MLKPSGLYTSMVKPRILRCALMVLEDFSKRGWHFHAAAPLQKPSCLSKSAQKPLKNAKNAKKAYFSDLSGFLLKPSGLYTSMVKPRILRYALMVLEDFSNRG